MTEESSVFVETVEDPAMLSFLDFSDNRSEILVSGTVLDAMPFEVENFVEDDEYWSMVDATRGRGYDNRVPISVWPGPNGRWIVDDDDAPRFMAAKCVAGEFFANLLGMKVHKVRFVLHETSFDGRYKALHTGFGQGD